jgi:cystathionine beta-lyase/cystathionine gamma-synthase
VAAGRKRKADTALMVALACGLSPEAAAQKSGLSVRTVYRRRADPSFRQQVQEVRTEMVRRQGGMFTAAGMAAIKTFTTLQESAKSESVRLGAARAIIEFGCKLRETEELMERMAELETRLEALLDEADAAEGGGDGGS